MKQILTAVESTTSLGPIRLRNRDVVQQIKKLQESLTTQHVFVTREIEQQFIDDAFTIYHQCAETPNYHVINTVLNVSLKHKHAHRVLAIWGDIEHALHRYKHIDNGISYSLALKCCIEAGDVAKSIQILETIEHCQYRLKIHDLYIRALLSKCDKLSQLEYIHRLLRLKFLINNDRFIKSALITAYGRCGSVAHACDAFDDTSEMDRDVYITSAMMKVYIDHKRYPNALQLYDSAQLHDNVTHMLALKACLCTRNFKFGNAIIEEMLPLRTNTDHQLLNTMIDFYGACQQLSKAQQLFEVMRTWGKKRDISSYNAMMSAYVENGCASDALQLFDAIDRDATTYLLAIKTCATVNDFERGHSIIISMSAMKHPHSDQLNTAIIHFYGQFKEVERARSAFDSIAEERKNMAMIGAMMNVYVENGMPAQTLELYDAIDSAATTAYSHIQHDVIAHILAFKACAQSGDLDRGAQIHRMHQTSYADNIAFNNALIDFYGRLNAIETAEQVFDAVHSTSTKDAVTIGSMMKAYLTHHRYRDALHVYDSHEAVVPLNNVCRMFAIKACTHLAHENKGRAILHVIDMDSANVPMKLAAIDFYGTFQDMETAQHVFDSICDVERTEGVVYTMMKAFYNHGEFEQVLSMFDAFACQHVASILLALKCCVEVGDKAAFEKGKEMHAKLEMRTGANNTSIQMYNALLEFYGHFRDISSLQKVFDAIEEQQRDTLCMNTMMHALIHCGANESALALYDSPSTWSKNERSHMLAMKACGNLGKFEKGQQLPLHDGTHNVHVQTAQIEFLGNCLDIAAAERIFESIPEATHNIVTIGAMMDAYMKNEKYDAVLSLYDRMVDTNGTVQPDRTAHMLAIKACGQLGEFEKGRQIHEHISGELRDSDIQLKTILIDFYGHCRQIETAQQMFMDIDNRDQNIICISAMMNAYFQNKKYIECIQLFQSIDTFGDDDDDGDAIECDLLTYRLVLAACSKLPHHFEIKQQIHDQLKEEMPADVFLHDGIIQSNLIAMYAQNGMIALCSDMFETYLRNQSEQQLLIVWNVMIHSYGLNGMVAECKHIFDRLQRHSYLQPDIYSFSALLSACSHSGDMALAQQIWATEIRDVQLKYHWMIVSILVDCCARNGCVYQAFEYLHEYEKLKSGEPRHEMYRAVMNGCGKFNNLSLAQHVYGQYKVTFPDSAVNEREQERICNVALLLANLYARNAQFDKVEEIRNELRKKECVSEKADERFTALCAHKRQNTKADAADEETQGNDSQEPLFEIVGTEL